MYVLQNSSAPGEVLRQKVPSAAERDDAEAEESGQHKRNAKSKLF